MHRSDLPEWYKVAQTYAQRFPLTGEALERQVQADKLLGSYAILHGEAVSRRMREAETAMQQEALAVGARIPPEAFVTEVLKRSGVDPLSEAERQRSNVLGPRGSPRSEVPGPDVSDDL